MATLVRWHIDDPQNVLDTFGAGALSRIEKSDDYTPATAGSATWSALTTVAVVATTTEHEYAHSAGVAGTTWYRIRYSTASPTLSTHYSGYGPVFQGGAPGGEVITLEVAKTYLGISDTDDDPWLPYAIGAINRAIIRRIGVDIGPSPDTTRYYDGCDAVRDGTRLWIPGGIRAFLTVAVSTDGGTTFTAVTNDVRIGPNAHSRPAGEPGAYIEFKSTAAISGAWSCFPDGTDNVRITATAFEGFGWSAYPDDLVQAGLAALQRLNADRSGRGAFPTETDAARYLNPVTMSHYHDMYFPRVR